MSYGLRVYGPNGSSLVLDEAMRHKRIIFQSYFSVAPGQEQTFDGIPEVNDFNKTNVVVSQYEMNYFTPSTSSYGAAYFDLRVGFYNSSRFYIYNTGDSGWDVTGDVVVVRVG